MENKLVLTDSDGNLVRAFHCNDEKVIVVRRFDTRRLEIVPSLDQLKKQKIGFESLGDIEVSQLKKQPFLVGQLGKLEFVDQIQDVVLDQKNPIVDQTVDRKIALGMFLFAVLFLSLMLKMPQNSEKIQKELEQHVVNIIKQVTPKSQVAMTDKMIQQNHSTDEAKSKTTVKNVKRLGALGVLGSLKTSPQKGGLNLGAVSTSRGPGLGGTEGSGGVQTSLYGKGIISAPLGAGGNIQGAGGYGTKGKGGGQEGYGKLSLVGSAGGSALGLGDEATVATGLEKDQIAEVIKRNIGQVRFCYEQGLQGNPSLNGRVAMNFTINKNGQVSEASVANSTINNKVIEDCVMLRLKSWKFPLPQGGVEVKVTYPFVLRRTGQG